MGTQFFWFYDILIISLILGITFRCAKRGFISTILGFLAVAAGFIAALYISAPASEYIYGTFIEKNIAKYAHDGINSVLGTNSITSLSLLDTSKVKVNGDYLSEIDLTPDSAGKITLDLSDVDLSETGIYQVDLTALGIDLDEVNFSELNIGMVNISAAQLADNGINTVISSKALAHAFQTSTKYGTLIEIVNQISDFLPQINPPDEGENDVFYSIIAAIINADIENAETALLDNFVKPIIMVPLRALIFFVIFAASTFLLSILAKSLTSINKIPIIGFLNSLFGGVVGIFESAVVIFVICITLHIIISVTGNTIIFLNVMTINETFIFKHIYNLEFLNFTN